MKGLIAGYFCFCFSFLVGRECSLGRLGINFISSCCYSMCAWMIDKFGDEEQRQYYLPRLCGMEYLSSYCLTEPGAGSDAGNIQTKAVEESSYYSLTGTKVRGVWSGGVWPWTLKGHGVIRLRCGISDSKV